MTVEAIRGAVGAAIERASQATGVDFGFLMRTARRESGYNPNAQAKTSSAAGLYQFVEQTWLGTLKQHGSKYGYARYAELIGQDASGRYRVSGADAHKTVMDLRLDPRASSLMAGELASDHASYLRGRVGRAPTNGELYAAHFLGPQGSARLIEAYESSPRSSAAAIFPGAASANPAIFYRSGRAATVAEVYANLTHTGGAGEAETGAREPQDGGAFVQYASARRSQRLEQEQAMTEMLLRGRESADNTGGLAGSMFTSEMLKLLSESAKAKA